HRAGRGEAALALRLRRRGRGARSRQAPSFAAGRLGADRTRMRERSNRRGHDRSDGGRRGAPPPSGCGERVKRKLPMVSRFGIGPLRTPPRLVQRWRARLRGRRRRRNGEGDVLFPADGRGMVAVHTLQGSIEETEGPRVAILHATAGSGHRTAAQAIAAAIADHNPHATVREVDTLVFASRLYRNTYAASYNAMAARAPRLWGVLYHSWGLAPVHKGTAPVRLAVDRLNLRRLVRVVERECPDAIVCTHFLPVEALSHRRGGGHLNVPLFCVITDFVAHPFC